MGSYYRQSTQTGLTRKVTSEESLEGVGGGMRISGGKHFKKREQKFQSPNTQEVLGVHSKCLLQTPQECHRPGSLQHRNVFPYSSGGWKPETSMSPAFLPGLLLASSPCVFVITLPLCMCILSLSSYEDSSQAGVGPTLVASFYINCLFQRPISKFSHTLKFYGLEVQRVNLGGHDSAPNSEIRLTYETVARTPQQTTSC